jgi:hypothetical protein
MLNGASGNKEMLKSINRNTNNLAKKKMGKCDQYTHQQENKYKTNKYVKNTL